MFSFRTTAIGEQLDKALTDGRVGCFCTQNCWDASEGRYLYDLFRERGNLEALFTPKSAELAPGTDHIDFSVERLRELDAIVVEIQDVGARYFNYTKDVFHLMDILKLLGDDAPSMYVVDHANPAGRAVEGSIPSGSCELFVPKAAHRHGLTLGELCNLYYSEIGARFALHVISAMAKDDNRVLMPWTIAPASDIPGLFTCHMYGGGGLWNDTSITPGIGTPRPYEYIGAPFIKPGGTGNLPVPPGAVMRPCSFIPSYGRYAGERCYGYQIMMVPGEDYHSLLHTLQLMRYFSGHYSGFEIYGEFYLKLADPVLADYIDGRIEFDEVREHVKTEEQKWIRKAKRFLLYEDQPFRMK